MARLIDYKTEVLRICNDMGAKIKFCNHADYEHATVDIELNIEYENTYIAKATGYAEDMAGIWKSAYEQVKDFAYYHDFEDSAMKLTVDLGPMTIKTDEATEGDGFAKWFNPCPAAIGYKFKSLDDESIENINKTNGKIFKEFGIGKVLYAIDKYTDKEGDLELLLIGDKDAVILQKARERADEGE